MQASRVQFIFRDDELEVALGETQKETENAFVGGANVWKYDTFTNWEFWWPSFPVLVYFKVGVRPPTTVSWISFCNSVIGSTRHW